MSSASSSGSSWFSYPPVDNTEYGLCQCGLTPKVDMSYTVKNPYRRFLCCPKFKDYQCKFFVWVDPWRPPQVDDVSTLNGAEERAKVNMWINEYSIQLRFNKQHQKKIKELEIEMKELQIANNQLKELEIEMKELQIANNQLNKKINILHIGISVLVLFVAYMILA